MLSFKAFIEEMAANCTGPAVVGTDPSDVAAPATPLLGKMLKRGKRNAAQPPRRSRSNSP